MTTPLVPVLPETAPFSEDQRSWLNGFFAGLLGADTGSATASPMSPTTDAPAAQVEEDDDDHPWHDAAMPMDERMALAEGRPLKSKMMAAMAQLDCGACGYLCQTYSAAIASGEEKNLTLCQPGGKDTAKKLKELIKTADITIEGKAPGNNIASDVTNEASGGFDRKNPFPAPLLAATQLNAAGSSKDTRYVSVDIMHSGLSYKAGDALGVYPENCYALVNDILSLLHASGGEIAMYRNQLIRELDIIKPTDELLELMQANATEQSDKDKIVKLLEEEAVEGLPAEPQVIDLLLHFENIKLKVKD
ncbi:MAG: sulfite reductase subunit alpha, partial [Phycisphaeraceae bacterium JB051]